MAGRVVSRPQPMADASAYVLKLEHLAPGVYSAVLHVNQQRFTKRIVVH